MNKPRPANATATFRANPLLVAGSASAQDPLIQVSNNLYSASESTPPLNHGPRPRGADPRP